MRVWPLALMVSFVVAASSTSAATLTDGCEAAQLAVVGEHASCHLQAIATGLRTGRAPDTSRCLTKLSRRVAGADAHFGAACALRGGANILDAHVRGHVAAISARLAPPPLTGAAAGCAAMKLRQSADLASCRASREASALAHDTPPDLARCETSTRAVFQRVDLQFGAACPTHADADTTLTEVARLTATLRLNVVVIYLDDTRADALAQMPPGMAPHLERLASEGVVFRNAFAPTPICAPSRASLLTGLRIQGGVRGGHGVPTLTSIAGFDDDITIATWFRAQARQSGLFGKYINGYAPPDFIASGDRMYVPPGWTRWLAVRSPEFYGGLLGKTWYGVAGDGTQTEYRGCCGRSPITPGCFPDDPACLDDQTYQTDVLSSELLDFVAAQSGAGWLAMLTPSASHGGHAVFPDPAARHLDTLAGLPLWRPPSFALPILDAPPHPPWDAVPLPTFPQPGLTDFTRQYALETLLAVDEAVGELFDTLEAEGVLDRTAIVLGSDNGVTWGEHTLWNQSKGCAYEECQRVPMIVRMPDGVGRVVDEPVLVTDLAPTIAALARVRVPSATDGRSFEPLLRGATPSTPWRTDYCVEFKPQSPQWVSYRGVRDVAGGFTYVEYDNGGVELFDLATDPAELVNVADQPAYADERARLAARTIDVCR